MTITRARFVTAYIASALVAFVMACGSRTGSSNPSTSGFVYVEGDAGSTNGAPSDNLPQMAECLPDADTIYFYADASYRPSPFPPNAPAIGLYTNVNSSFSANSDVGEVNLGGTYYDASVYTVEGLIPQSCRMTFAAYEPVVPGTYTFAGYNGPLEFISSCYELGYSCTATSGTLTITSVEPTSGQDWFGLTSFAAYFDVHCDDANLGEVRGCVRYTAGLQ